MEIITRFGNLIAAGSKHAGEEGGHHVEVSPLASFYGLFVLFGITFIAIAVFLTLAKQGLNSKFFRRTSSQLLEQLYVFVEGLAVGIIGPHGRKYIPMMMVFWLVIFFGNLLALLIHSSPTSDLSFNLGMALVAMGYVQYEGMRANGVFGHFSHFAGPKLPLAMIPITLMIFVIELISEMMKNVSLSLRLYGNIFGGGEAVTAMNKLGENYGVPWLNFGDFLFPIKLLTCVVQALIFCLLFAVYLSLVTHHEHEEGHDHESHGEAVPAH